jgi:hypothetical protein
MGTTSPAQLTVCDLITPITGLFSWIIEIVSALYLSIFLLHPISFTVTVLNRGCLCQQSTPREYPNGHEQSRNHQKVVYSLGTFKNQSTNLHIDSFIHNHEVKEVIQQRINMLYMPRDSSSIAYHNKRYFQTLDKLPRQWIIKDTKVRGMRNKEYISKVQHVKYYATALYSCLRTFVFQRIRSTIRIMSKDSLH